MKFHKILLFIFGFLYLFDGFIGDDVGLGS